MQIESKKKKKEKMEINIHLLKKGDLKLIDELTYDNLLAECQKQTVMKEIHCETMYRAGLLVEP